MDGWMGRWTRKGRGVWEGRRVHVNAHVILVLELLC